MTDRTSIAAALAAALLFGASMPFAKLLAGNLSPVLLAGLLYLGSGLGLWAARLVRDRGFGPSRLRAGEWCWLGGAIACGGVLGPVLLMLGLNLMPASAASLLLNLEAVLTALLAWLVFRENAGRRVVLGMMLIVAGGALLAWPAGGGTAAVSARGVLAVAGACLCWALDNNLTRKVSGADALFIAGTKGLAAGLTNLLLAAALGARAPQLPLAAGAMAVGLAGYGLSLALFVVALRGLGSARTGAYFSTAPFLGAAVAIAMLREPAPAAFWFAAVLMAAGVWLHLSERHDHEHTHQPLSHTHPHRHDAHHRHEHDFNWDGTEPHVHPHRHEWLVHSHPHYPDLHHRHRH
ncbi:MAG TPA: EamA family transporter [Nevskia sp.]|nr:EamA family transporter [Nevskia sp.]